MIAVTKVACLAGVGNERRLWQWTGTSTKRKGGISIVGGDEEIGKGDGVGKEVLPGEGVCFGNQGSMFSEGIDRVAHPGVATLDGRVSGDEVREVKVAVDVSEGELMMFGEWCCRWEKRTEERRRRGGVSDSLPGWTSHVSTPARLSRSLLRPSILSIGSSTCAPTGSHGGVRSSRFRILLRLLLNRVAELGSSGCGLHFLCMALEEKCGTCGESSKFWGGGVDT